MVPTVRPELVAEGAAGAIPAPATTIPRYAIVEGKMEALASRETNHPRT